jgi:NADP-dependent aldehyde dehydrogenase
MAVSGDLFIGSQRVKNSETIFASTPATGDTLEPGFSAAGPAEIEQACNLACAAFHTSRELEPELRAKFLETAADQIMALGDELLERASSKLLGGWGEAKQALPDA